LPTGFFLNKTLGNRIDSRKQNNNPKQCVPSNGLNAVGFEFKADITHEYSGHHIEHHAIESIFLPPF
jgi:hypothetical protein